jgi:hypothetical protein
MDTNLASPAAETSSVANSEATPEPADSEISLTEADSLAVAGYTLDPADDPQHSHNDREVIIDNVIDGSSLWQCY